MFFYWKVQTILFYLAEACNWSWYKKYKFKFSFSQTESNWDVVTIYDGSNDQSTQIEKLSGNLGSFNISSTGKSLFVKFKSDAFVTEDGFHATIHYGNPYLNIK